MVNKYPSGINTTSGQKSKLDPGDILVDSEGNPLSISSIAQSGSYSAVQGASVGTSISGSGLMGGITAFGDGVTHSLSSFGLRSQHTISSADPAGISTRETGSNGALTRVNMLPRLKVRMGTNTVFNHRFWIALAETDAATLSSGDSHAAISYVGFRASSAGNWNFVSNDGASGITTVDTGIALANASTLTFTITFTATSNAILTIFREGVGSATTTLTTNLPSALDDLAFHSVVENTDGSSLVEIRNYFGGIANVSTVA